MLILDEVLADFGTNFLEEPTQVSDYRVVPANGVQWLCEVVDSDGGQRHSKDEDRKRPNGWQIIARDQCRDDANGDRSEAGEKHDLALQFVGVGQARGAYGHPAIHCLRCRVRHVSSVGR